MGNISSIHFELSKSHITAHNDRTLKPSYLKGKEYECSLSSDDAQALYQKLLNDAVKNYTDRTGQKPQFHEDKLKWSAVVNIKPDTTMQDLKKLAEHFENKYGFQCYQYAIHKDEGTPLFEDTEKTKPKLDKDGNQIFKPNLHGHLEFLMLNKQGITCFKKKDFGIKKMKQIQTEVAEILDMKRGQENSQAQRLTHQQYKQEQERIASETLSLKQENSQLQQENQKLKSRLLTKKEQTGFLGLIRKNWIKDGTHSQEEYKQLNALKQKTYTQEELDKAIAELNAQHEQRMTELQESSIRSFATLQEQSRDEKIKLTSEIEVKDAELAELEAQNTALQADNDRLTSQIEVKDAEIERLKTELLEKPKEIIKTETVVRKPTADEIEELPRVQQLKKQLQEKPKEIVKTEQNAPVAELKEYRQAFDFIGKTLSVKPSDITQVKITTTVAAVTKLKKENYALQNALWEIGKVVEFAGIKVEGVLDAVKSFAKTARDGLISIIEKCSGLSLYEQHFIRQHGKIEELAETAVKSVSRGQEEEREQEELSHSRSFHR